MRGGTQGGEFMAYVIYLDQLSSLQELTPIRFLRCGPPGKSHNSRRKDPACCGEPAGGPSIFSPIVWPSTVLFPFMVGLVHR